MSTYDWNQSGGFDLQDSYLDYQNYSNSTGNNNGGGGVGCGTILLFFFCIMSVLTTLSECC